jgi:hypothetical protein
MSGVGNLPTSKGETFVIWQGRYKPFSLYVAYDQLLQIPIREGLRAANGKGLFEEVAFRIQHFQNPMPLISDLLLNLQL